MPRFQDETMESHAIGGTTFQFSGKKINELGTTVIITTHNKGVIDFLNKRVITLDAGKVIRDDKHGKYIL